MAPTWAGIVARSSGQPGAKFFRGHQDGEGFWTKGKASAGKGKGGSKGGGKAERSQSKGYGKGADSSGGGMWVFQPNGGGHGAGNHKGKGKGAGEGKGKGQGKEGRSSGAKARQGTLYITCECGWYEPSHRKLKHCPQCTELWANQPKDPKGPNGKGKGKEKEKESDEIKVDDKPMDTNDLEAWLLGQLGNLPTAKHDQAISLLQGSELYQGAVKAREAELAAKEAKDMEVEEHVQPLTIEGHKAKVVALSNKQGKSAGKLRAAEAKLKEANEALEAHRLQATELEQKAATALETMEKRRKEHQVITEDHLAAVQQRNAAEEANKAARAVPSPPAPGAGGAEGGAGQRNGPREPKVESVAATLEKLATQSTQVNERVKSALSKKRRMQEEQPEEGKEAQEAKQKKIQEQQDQQERLQAQHKELLETLAKAKALQASFDQATQHILAPQDKEHG